MPSPSRDATKLIYHNGREREGTISFCRILVPPHAMPPQHTPPTPQYVFILMGVIIFCRILALPNAPPPQTPQYLTILRTERGRHYVCRILAPPMPPPPATTPQLYLTILMTERSKGRHYFLYDFGAPQCPPPQTPQYLTI